MSDKPSFFTELKRRHVWRVAIAYAVVAWLLLPAAPLAGRQQQDDETTADPSMGRIRALLLGSLAVAFAIGWYGILVPRHYAAPRFSTPWRQTARQAAAALDHGDVVIGNKAA